VKLLDLSFQKLAPPPTQQQPWQKQQHQNGFAMQKILLISRGSALINPIVIEYIVLFNFSVITVGVA
jgi:hypothetical protein